MLTNHPFVFLVIVVKSREYIDFLAPSLCKFILSLRNKYSFPVNVCHCIFVRSKIHLVDALIFLRVYLRSHANEIQNLFDNSFTVTSLTS